MTDRYVCHKPTLGTFSPSQTYALPVHSGLVLSVNQVNDSVIYCNAFVTNHSINLDNVVEVIESGRCRWKTKNENHNVLKTKGYNLSKRVTRKGFFQDILALTKYILFDGQQHLIDFMLGDIPVLANSS